MTYQFPLFFRVRQLFSRPKSVRVAEATQKAVDSLLGGGKLQAGQSVAITAGSRGICNIAEILKSAAGTLKNAGARPFIVPAMGSHGGATADGQIEVLRSYGITEDYCECPIRSSMETVVLGAAPEGFPIHFDRYALQADHVLVCNRIKPHTMFVGDIESGLMKMLLIGLGKHQGALVYHRAIQDYDFGRIVRSVGRFVLENVSILGGLAIVENAFEETCLVESVRPSEFETREPELLQLARQWLPKLPFPEIDLLIVDEIGKNISGTGMDTNIIGRKFNDRAARDDEWPKIRRIAVRSLTEDTRGNACGIGIADVCLKRTIEQIDRKKTIANCVTAGHLSAGAEPIAFSCDQEMLQTVLGTIGLRGPGEARIVWIRNTLHLEEIECSQAYWNAASGDSNLKALSQPRGLPFDVSGNLPNMDAMAGV